jgi:hypothetical protein
MLERSCRVLVARVRRPWRRRWVAVPALLAALVATAAVAEVRPGGEEGQGGVRPPAAAAAVTVELVTDEAEAVLAILDQRARGEQPAAESWQQLFASEGYRRLARREAAMGRAFAEEDFRAFVLGDELLAKREALRATLASWRRLEPAASAQRALAYLPAGAKVRARIYPVIKPRDNSFVFEIDTDPAIFLYLDPTLSAEQFANTLAHELHHIGYGTACPTPEVEAALANLPPGAARVAKWVGAFGEGLAMLAAAGGPDVHPHAASPAADRERWDRDVASFPTDLAKVDGFFRDLLAGRLDEPAELAAARGFYGIQGPWYTVGWVMASEIERARGRAALVASSCDPRAFLRAWDEVATASGQARFSAEVLAAFAGGR